jgi:hypothetical protein
MAKKKLDPLQLTRGRWERVPPERRLALDGREYVVLYPYDFTRMAPDTAARLLVEVEFVDEDPPIFRMDWDAATELPVALQCPLCGARLRFASHVQAMAFCPACSTALEPVRTG